MRWLTGGEGNADQHLSRQAKRCGLTVSFSRVRQRSDTRMPWPFSHITTIADNKKAPGTMKDIIYPSGLYLRRMATTHGWSPVGLTGVVFDFKSTRVLMGPPRSIEIPCPSFRLNCLGTTRCLIGTIRAYRPSETPCPSHIPSSDISVP